MKETSTTRAASVRARAQTKTRLPEPTKTGEPGFDYQAHDIAPADVRRLQALKDEHRMMGRADAEQTFDRGRLLNTAAAILVAKDAEDASVQKTAVRRFSAWLKQECGITDRHARNFMAVDRDLQPFRTRMIEAALSPTVLFKLAPAGPERIEDVLGAFEAGRRLTVREVVAIIGGERASGGDEEVPLADRGGVKALRELALDKARRGTGEVTEHLLGILRVICLELEPAERRRRVEKGKLAALIAKPARLARRELVELTQCVRVSEHWDGGSGGFEHENLPQGGWDDFEQLLYKLGGIDSWPEAGELVDWLTTKVVPGLCWALEGAVPKELDQELTERLAAIAAIASKGKRAQNDNTEPTASAA